MKESVAKKLWVVAKPILQKEKNGVGRPQFSVYKAFKGIMFVLENGCKWRDLPWYYGKPSTVHGKFMKWVRSGRWQIIFESMRSNYMNETDAFKNWFATDTSYSKAPYARFGGKNPTDRGKRGIKKHLIVDSRGAPLVVSAGPANQHDSKTILNLLRLARSFSNKQLSIVVADSAYDSKKLRKESADQNFVLHASTNKRRRNDLPMIKPKGRNIIEATHSWLNNFRSVKTCFAKTAESFTAFLQIAAAVQLFRMI